MWDFPLLNVASAMVVSGGVIERIRIAVNAAAARPLRLTAVEKAVVGQPPSAATGEMAGKLAVHGAVPLQFNAYKIPLMSNLVKRHRRRGGGDMDIIERAENPWGQDLPIHIAWSLIWVAVGQG